MSMRRKQVLLAFLALAAVIGAPELALRAARTAVNAYTAIPFGNDPNSARLFVRDPDLLWALRPGARVEFLGATVEIGPRGLRGEPAAPGRRRVLCLGDSATFGWRVSEAETWPARLGAMLREGSGPPEWEALNAGVPGYSSFQVRRLAERLLPQVRPEVVVVCCGNNDSSLAFRSDADFFAHTRLRRAADRVLSHSRLFLWLRDRLPQRTVGTLASLTDRPRTPRAGPRDYGENLRAVVRAARVHGARAVIVTPTRNVASRPVLTATGRRAAQAEAWREAMAELLARGDRAEAARRIDARLAAATNDVDAMWYRGMMLVHEGQIAEGREWIERAFECDVYPERAARPYLQRVRAVAAEEEVTLVDSEQVLLARAKGPFAGEFFLDSCHPTAEGYRLIAEAIRDAIGK
jgi:lysophospholipase L1-like esterase